MKSRINNLDISRIVRRVINEQINPQAKDASNDAEFKYMTELLMSVSQVLKKCGSFDKCLNDDGTRYFLNNNLPDLISKLEIFNLKVNEPF